MTHLSLLIACVTLGFAIDWPQETDYFLEAAIRLSNQGSGPPFAPPNWNTILNQSTIIAEPLLPLFAVSNACFLEGTRKVWVLCGDETEKTVGAAGEDALKTYTGVNMAYELKMGCIAPDDPKLDGLQFQDTVIATSIPIWSKHLTHVSDSVISHTHALLRPKKYPWWADVEEFHMLIHHHGELKWNQKLINNVFDIDGHSPVKVLWRDDLPPNRCYRRVVASTSFGNSRGGSRQIHSPIDGLTLRRRVWADLGLEIPVRLLDTVPLKVFLITRGRGSQPGRHVSNKDALYRWLGEQPWVDQDFLRYAQKNGDLGALPFRTQVDIMRQTDILLGVHGSGLENLIYMQTFSAIIELEFGTAMETGWLRTAHGTGLYAQSYIPDATKGNLCLDNYKHILDNPDIQPMKRCNVEVNLARLEVQLCSAVNHVRLFKRKPSDYTQTAGHFPGMGCGDSPPRRDK